NNNHDDNGRYGDDDDVDLSVHASGSEATGDVSLIVDIDDADPFDTYVLDSPSLDAGCFGDDLTGSTAETDRFGHLDVSADANNCIPGEYKIAAYQPGGGEETYYGHVKIH
ncbi:MAG: hypothetical protein ACRDTE_21925, partial [Pseudonocardiaceae bacterium]